MLTRRGSSKHPFEFEGAGMNVRLRENLEAPYRTQSLRDAVLYYRKVKFRHHDDLRPGVLASSVEISF